jgi:predicted GNAT family acetyltransferase
MFWRNSGIAEISLIKPAVFTKPRGPLYAKYAGNFSFRSTADGVGFLGGSCMAGSVRKNAEAKRFELPLDDSQIAFVSYTEADGGVVELVHTEVPDEFEGQGKGKQLISGALDILKSEERKVVPTCAFVAAFVQRHPEYQSLVDK